MYSPDVPLRYVQLISVIGAHLYSLRYVNTVFSLIEQVSELLETATHINYVNYSNARFLEVFTTSTIPFFYITVFHYE